MRRLVFHVDVNSAFLSWEAARRVARGEPDLRLIPSAVGGDRDKRTGVILAKSIPAKKFNITTGEPVSSALRKCPTLTLVKPDFALYESCSRAFMDICRDYTPTVEKFSIDECFLDMTGTEKLFPDPVAAADELRERIRDTLGFTVNVGVAENKLCAKMASDFTKPDKTHTLFPDEIRTKLWPLPVRDLFSVGKATAEKLESAYITTIGELAVSPPARVKRLVGEAMGEHILRYANGIDDSPVSDVPEEAKGYSNSTTLAEDVTTVAEARRILLALTDSVAMRMRADGVCACGVSVTVRDLAFRDRSHQKKLPRPTDITSEIYGAATQLLSELWDGKTPLRLFSVAVFDLTHGEARQLSLFTEDEESRERARLLDKTVDSIRREFGVDTLLRASSYKSGLDVGRKYKAKLEAPGEEDGESRA